ncbi:hypothetical protein PORY_001207 [Pneumocystis oryctolagi]|uniref:Uncharacterized protein n=1 Tax=Pneumocystis oryctolagi TaxID=42067 RepID=A0ACB7CDL5_9ASCO|nr:hypothetical protein PORY_001207 [Pneumocystis oryctolagi]
MAFWELFLGIPINDIVVQRILEKEIPLFLSKDRDSCLRDQKVVQKRFKTGKEPILSCLCRCGFYISDDNKKCKNQIQFLEEEYPSLQYYIAEIKSSNDKEALCNFWGSYCDTFTSHSDALSNEASGNSRWSQRLQLRSTARLSTAIDGICNELKPLKVGEQIVKVTTTTERIIQRSMNTSTTTLTSTRRCKPTKCATEGEGDEEEHVKPSGGVKIGVGSMMRNMQKVIEPKKRNLARAVAVPRAVKRDGAAQDEIEEELLLALIVKDKYNNDGNCKDELEKYCKGLSGAKVDHGKVHEKLKGLCEKPEDKCKDLKTKVKPKCDTLKNKLLTVLGSLNDKDCAENGRQCLFLEGACPGDLKENCNKLRNKCYQNKRDEVAEEVLLRALGDGSLKNSKDNKCGEQLKKICKKLSDKSNELALSCSDATKTCQNLEKTIAEKCKTLKEAIGKMQDPPTNETCLSLLEQCHFYGSNCENQEELKCEELETKCSGKGFTFTPPGTPFNPIKPPITLAEQIGLKALYEKAAKDGVHIGSALTQDVFNLLALLTPTTGNNIEDECKTMLDKNCKDLKTHPILGSLCTNDTTDKASQEGKDVCTALKNKLNDLPEKIKSSIQGAENILQWHQLSDQLREGECTRMLSKCFYFELHDKNNVLEKPCANVRVACYKRGLGAAANALLEEHLRGKFNDTDDKHEEFLAALVGECQKLKTKGELGNDELLSRCLQPLSTIENITLYYYIYYILLHIIYIINIY